MLIWCFIVFFFHISFAADYIFKPGPFIPATKGEIWPKPQNQEKLSDEYFTVIPSFFQFKNTGAICKTLHDALKRYKKILLVNNRYIKELYFQPQTCYDKNDQDFLGYLTELDVELTQSCYDDVYPSLEMKEEYNLTLTRDIRKLTSDTIWGILRGLESFSQLMYLTDDFSCHRIDSVNIYDYPRFAHRGLLLDTSRHYQTKESILKLIDTMEYNKFNVFHWHITDDSSFPYVSKSFPEMSEKGAYHPSLMIYDQTFISQVQEYARSRGIRVLVEFDTPGHTLSWGLSVEDLLTECHDVDQLEWGPIDPSKQSTYDFIFKFYDEIKEVFKDQYTHLGGDEVDFSCWKSNANITQFMKDNGIENDYVALQGIYTQELINYVNSLDLKSIVWEEVFTSGVTLPKTTAVQVWINTNANETLAQVTAAGHPAIMSSYWYLDQLATGGDWLKFYNVDPIDFEGDEEQKQLVIGGEACMWSEFVDENNLESRVWPRASVAAEKFWSAYEPPISFTVMEELFPVAARLQEHSCRLNRRGIKAQSPSGPNVCF